MNSEEIGPFRTQDGVLVWFWEDAKEYGSAGSPLYASVLFMKVAVPGDNKSEPIYEVEVVYQEGKPHPIFGKVKQNKDILERFGKCIADYKARQGGPAALTGTPLDKAPWINKSMSLTLKHNGVYTVEDLAGLSDSGLERVGMGARGLKQKAADFLSASEKTATQMQSAERERQMQGQIDRLSQQMEDLADVFAELPPEIQTQAKKSLAKKGHKVAA